VPEPAEAARIGAELLATLGESDGGVPRASAGVAWSAPGADTPDELIARADAAMYVAKKTGTGLGHLESVTYEAEVIR